MGYNTKDVSSEYANMLQFVCKPTEVRRTNCIKSNSSAQKKGCGRSQSHRWSMKYLYFTGLLKSTGEVIVGKKFVETEMFIPFSIKLAKS